MSTVDQMDEDNITVIKAAIEDYQSTIHAIQCFISITTWKDGEVIPDSHSSIGRKMDTSTANPIESNNTVTPDIVIQRTELLGYVAEVKKSLPQNQDYWRKIVEQLRKYDDDLVGWWTDDELIEEMCVVLLLHISRVADFRDFLIKKMSEETIEFKNPVCLVEFTRSPEMIEFIFLRNFWGEIKDHEVADVLRSGKQIPIEKVVSTYGVKKYYDSVPETVHTMVILWQDVFNPMRSDVEFDESQRAWPLKVSISDLTTELQKLYGSPGGGAREVSFPKPPWIKTALDNFVKQGLAKPLEEDGYVVFFKLLKTDLIERFAKHESKKADEKNTSEQIALF